MNELTRHGCRHLRVVLAAGVLGLLVGCHHTVTVDPIRVEPIHLTLDITLKVDDELDRFFDFEDPGTPSPSPAPAPAPASPPDAGREEGTPS